ncbi:hypothetical protein Naga_101567g2 [Nannochloropsis gaditana]|uniref:Uncharacterized protein n=1 Tax=Nannochloropsis gaditana TaxID=72520 RepID=W7TRG7_9STRA|nr:hypothetical protein Naga_101567g2 [Nannochloropsis gaditana]
MFHRSHRPPPQFLHVPLRGGLQERDHRLLPDSAGREGSLPFRARREDGFGAGHGLRQVLQGEAPCQDYRDSPVSSREDDKGGWRWGGGAAYGEWRKEGREEGREEEAAVPPGKRRRKRGAGVEVMGKEGKPRQWDG